MVAYNPTSVPLHSPQFGEAWTHIPWKISRFPTMYVSSSQRINFFNSWESLKPNRDSPLHASPSTINSDTGCIKAARQDQKNSLGGEITASTRRGSRQLFSEHVVNSHNPQPSHTSAEVVLLNTTAEHNCCSGEPKNLHAQHALHNRHPTELKRSQAMSLWPVDTKKRQKVG